MFALNLIACFASLLDNKVARMPFDDRFNLRSFVSGDDDEARDVRGDAIVLSRRKLDRLDALFCRALAMEWEHLLDAMLSCTFLDPLVDRTEDLLVVRGRVRELHQHILP